MLLLAACLFNSLKESEQHQLTPTGNEDLSCSDRGYCHESTYSTSQLRSYRRLAAGDIRVRVIGFLLVNITI